MTNRKPRFLTRHNAASPREFQYYASGIPIKHLCRMLNRHERTVKDWLNGNAVIPPWATAVLRLNRLEHQLMLDQMGISELEREARAKAQSPAIRPRPAANEQVYATQLRLDYC